VDVVSCKGGGVVITRVTEEAESYHRCSHCVDRGDCRGWAINQARSMNIELVTITVIFVGSWAWSDKTYMDYLAGTFFQLYVK
jgi:hypothetical protein